MIETNTINCQTAYIPLIDFCTKYEQKLREVEAGLITLDELYVWIKNYEEPKRSIHLE